MRLLVACAECHRQYDATGRPLGRRFHCHCGAIITIEQPRGHDAAVVRCSSCGAARQENTHHCGFCGSDYTLHERDLHTVCPGCLARVSDRARFCHHCGIGLVPELNTGQETALKCPACPQESLLTSRRLGAEQVTVLECGRCTGLWLGHEAFRQLSERVRRAAVPAASDPRPAPHPQPQQQGKLYRPCVVCSRLMHRCHYARGSGVVLDVCKPHGLWFDADELARVLAWLRAGGEPKPRESAAASAAPQAPERRTTRSRTRTADRWSEDDDPLVDILRTVGQWLGQVIR